jgi:hypothetical protein
MLVRCQGHTNPVTGEESDQTESIQRGPVQKNLRITDFDKLTPLALIVADELTFTDLHFTHNT